jgi:hypothetical protein
MGFDAEYFPVSLPMASGESTSEHKHAALDVWGKLASEHGDVALLHLLQHPRLLGELSQQAKLDLVRGQGNIMFRKQVSEPDAEGVSKCV